ncbi:O-glycosyl hydrolase [Rathayibacter sp. PhB151]|uniref:glycoside hydrolase n=1 Tax=Rathayibacter sp. PhB151 TaxID=2485189 RepID=UPI00106384C6|nr:glycoside hydrolase [Rathayibacter sp. PhB151]TDX81019.1 O-glycosyl hydrolase [Rathayibacter sp. PhB151]
MRTNQTRRAPRRARLAVAGALAVATAAAGLATGPVAVAAAPVTIGIHPGTSYQTIQGWGTSLAWWAEGSGRWASVPAREALATALFDPVDGLGFTVARYVYGADGPANTCAATQWPESDFHSFQPTQGTYDWADTSGQTWMLRAAQKRGANVFQATNYSAPVWMTKTACSMGDFSAPGTDNLDPAFYDDYAAHLATVTKHLQTTTGVPISSIEPFNEPKDTTWPALLQDYPTPGVTTPIGTQGMNASQATQNAVYQELIAALSSRGMTPSTGIAASDEVSVASTVAGVNSYSPAVRDGLTQIDTHDYGGGDGNAVRLVAERENTSLWMSEWGSNGDRDDTSPTSMGAALELSSRIIKNQDEMHPEAWVIWQAVDGPTNGGKLNDLWGLVYADYAASGSGELTFPKRYYAMGQYSKFLRPGSVMIADTDPSTMTAYDFGSGKLVAVATNSSGAARDIALDLRAFGGTASATAFRTSATESIAPVSAGTIAGSTLTSSLPANSITTFVIDGLSYSGANARIQVDDATIGTGANQWSYSAGWGHCAAAACGDPQNLHAGTTSYTGQKDATATLSFTGTKVALRGVTGPTAGIARVSIDGGPPTDLDLYAAQRHGDQLIWQSPDLASGPHTLEFRHTGRFNPQASQSVSALDRAEVTTTAAPAAGSLVSQADPGTVRNDLTGEVGLSFTTGASPVTVTALGRQLVTGSTTGVHQLSLYDSTTGTAVATAALDTAVSETDGLGFQYRPLAAPVTLAAGRTYHLASAEAAGGDQWREFDSTVALRPGFTANGPAYRLPGGTWTVFGATPTKGYGLVNLLTSP